VPDTQSGLKRPRRWRLVLFAGVLLLAAAGVVVFFGSGPRLDAWARARLRTELANALGRPVSVGEVHVAPFASRFVANEIVVGEVPPGKGRVLEVRQIAGTIRLRSLLRGRLEIEDLLVVAPHAVFAHRGDRLEGPLPVRRREGLTAPSSGSVKIVVRRLKIDDGLVSFDDEKAPFWCRAEGLSLLWQGDELGNGSGTLETERITGGSGQVVQMGSLHAEAVLQGGSLTGRMEGTWPAGSARIEAAITLPTSSGAAASGELHGAVHVEESEAGPVFAGLLHVDERLAGKIDVNGSVRFQGAKWSGQGKVEGRDLRYGDLAAETASMEVRVADGTIEMRDVDVRALGGRITGSARIPTAKGGMVEVTAHGDALSLHEVLATAGLPSPLTGSVSAEAALSVIPGDLDSLRLRAPVRVAGVGSVRGGAPRERVNPVSAEGLVTIEKKLLLITSDRLVSGGLTTSLRVEKPLNAPETRLRLVGALTSLGETSALIESFMADQPDGSLLPWDSSRLAGAGTFDGEVLFRKDSPARGHAEFAFRDFAYEGIGAETLSGSALSDGAELFVTIPRGEKNGGTVALEGHFPVAKGSPSRITGEMRDWPLDDVLARLGAPQGATVRGSGPIAVRIDDAGVGADTTLQLTDARVGDLVFTSGAFEASMRDGRIDIAEIALDGPQATVHASGSYAIDAGELTGTLDATHVDVAVASPWLKGVPLSGHAAIASSLQYKDGAPSWTARLIPEEDLAFSGRPIRDVRADVTGDGETARFEGTFGTLARFSGSVGLAAPHQGEGRIELEAVPIAPLLELSRPDIAGQTGGEMTGTIEWSGPLDDTSAIAATGSFSPVRIALGTESFETEGPAALHLSGGAVHIDDAVLSSATARIRVNGSIPLDDKGTIDLTVDGKMDLGVIAAFVPEMSAAGQVTASIRLTGSPARPDLSGTFALDKGRLRLIDFPLVADQIHLNGTIDGTGITSDDITGVLGGGSFSGSGHVDLDGLGISAFRLQGRVANTALALPEGFRGQYSGSVRFEQEKGEIPVLSGNLELDRGIWQQNFELDKLTLGQKARPPVFQVAAPTEGLARTRLDLKIHADDNVWCHNDLADIEGRADLVVGGTVSGPELTGRYDAFEGGEMRFSRVRYIVDHAAVLFPAGTTFNPEYDITAETQIQEYEVHIHLSGSLDKLETYDLTSIPPLPEQQILAMLVTGVAATEGTTAETNQVGNQTASLVGGAVGSVVSGQLEKWLGIEEIRIEPFISSTSSSTTDPTTRVTLGKRLSPRIFVRTSVSLNSTDDPIYQVEYVLTRKVRLQLERGELGSIGGGARYATRFFSPSVRSQGEAMGTVVKKSAPQKIAEVRFSGDADLDGTALRKVAHMRPGKVFTRQKMVEGADRLKKHFVKESYLEASVRPGVHTESAEQVTVEYTIEKGPKVEVKIEGSGVYERRIRETLESLWKESSFGGEFASEGETRIRRLLQEEGFYACLVNVVTVEEAGVKHLIFHVDAGEKVSVQNLTLEGVHSVPESDVRAQILTGTESLFRHQPLKPSVLATDVASVVNLYRSRGYLEVQAHSHVLLAPDATSAVVRIDVVEGPPSRVRSIAIEGAKAFPVEELKKEVKSLPGEPFIPAQVVADRAALKRKYDLAGYPEATVEEQLVREGENLDLVYKIVEGPSRRVATVAVEGNTLTKERVVMEKVTLRPGDPISAEKMRETRQNLMKTGLFSDAQLHYDPAADGAQGQTLRIKVSEAENLILGLGGGYDTEDGPRASVEFANVNLFGTGRYAGIGATYGGKLSRAQIIEKEPHVFGWLWGSTLTLFYENRERDTFTERQVGTSALLTRKTAGPLTHFLRYSVALSDVYDVTNEETFHQENFKLDLGKLRLANMGYAIVRDTRNDPFAATRGTIASADLRVFDRAIGSEKRLAKLFLQGGYTRTIPWGFVWATTLRVGVAWRGDDEAIPLQERFFAGGIASVRGFEQDTLGFVRTDKVVHHEMQDTDGDGIPDTNVRVAETVDTGTLEHDSLTPLGGESSLIYNNELRHKIYGSISGVAFVDLGNIYPRNTDIFSLRMRYTGGLGVRVDTPVGPLRLEYGFKFDRAKGESPGEFVLSLGQTF